MISIKQIATDINAGLNTIVANTPLMAGDNDTWVFDIGIDTLSVKKATRDDNLVTHYIMGQVSVLSSEFENTGRVEASEPGSGQTATSKIANVSLNIGIELLVPVLDREDTNGNIQLATAVRKIIDIYFALSRTGIVEDDDGLAYSYSLTASVGATGARDIRYGVGDSITFIVGAEYRFTMNGVNSRALQVTIDGVPVDWLTFGMMRQSDQEPAVPGDTTDAAAKSMLTGTTLSINYTKLLTLATGAPSPDDEYIFTGTNYCVDENGNEVNVPNVAHLISVRRPSYIASNTIQYFDKDYFMSFSNTGNNGMLDSNISVSVQMLEADMSEHYASPALHAKYPRIGLNGTT